MPPKPKDSKPKSSKVGTTLKDIVPGTIKQLPRDSRLIKPAEFLPIQHKINEFTPPPSCEDWPGDEAALTHEFGLDSINPPLFTDPKKFMLPPSFSDDSQIVFWRRAKDCVINERSIRNFEFDENKKRE